MSKSKKPRKPYKHKAIRTFGGLPVLAARLIKAEPLTEEQRIDVLADYYAALDAFAHGRGQYNHFEKLVYAVNVSRVLYDMDIFDGDTEHEHLIDAGMAAVYRIKERAEKTGQWGMTGDERKALYELEDLHRAMLEVATKGEIEAAIAEMWHRIRAGISFEIKEIGPEAAI